MKFNFSFLLVLFFLISCNKQLEHADKKEISECENKDEGYYTGEDTVFIVIRNDTIKYGKCDYNKIIDNNPELVSEYPQDPNLLYACKTNYNEFRSEAGQDSYFILYHHFLKQKNGVKEYENERKKLVDIYSNINSLYGGLKCGGTYFGHQYLRLLGYAEYSVYLYKSNKSDIGESYPINKQKELYIKSLYQLLEDEMKFDTNRVESDKEPMLRELRGIVGEIDKLITNVFYLRRAQEFQYRYYEYY